ncbi:hypothetical protein DB346_12225 [Verrucomicrobia bacterium LW23]|nr:hypothetical protein DB346_12225 [Verrucomicrobia bacterium LW23]
MLSRLACYPTVRLMVIIWLVAWIALPPAAWSNPSGGTVRTGSATVSGGPGNLTVHQSSGRAIIHWNDFSINKGETTTFVQPGVNSATLNRVTGGATSNINGMLNANGKLYLVNPNGVVIGTSGRVNAAGFTASTHDVTDSEFMAGGNMRFRGTSRASVINHGKIRATEGDVTLIARQVENHGKIRAPKGSVNLAGAMEVLVKPSGEQRVYIKSGDGSVANSGSIHAAAAELRAAGGNEYALAINNSGTIRATAVDRSGGRIVLRAGSGITQNSGSLIAKSDAPGKNGGRIDVTGQKVWLTKTSRIDASSKYAKGGTVNVGGGYQGKDATILNAQVTAVEKGSTIKATGGTQGGTAIVWSDETTRFYGDINVEGAAGATPGSYLPGTGGFAEISSKGYLDFNGTVTTGGGKILLDPSNIYIGTVDSNMTPTPGSTLLLESSAAVSSIDVATLELLLASSDVEVRTSGDFHGDSGIYGTLRGDNASGNIFVVNDLMYTSDFKLTLTAHNDIVVVARLENLGSGDIDLVAGIGGGPLPYGNNGSLQTDTGFGIWFVPSHGGSVFVGGGPMAGPDAYVATNGALSVYGYNVSVQASAIDDSFAQLGGPNTTGSINVVAVNDIIVAGSERESGYAQIGNGGMSATAGATIDGTIMLSANGTLSVTAGSGPGAYAQVGHGGSGFNTGAGGVGIAATMFISATNVVVSTVGGGQNSYAQIGHGGYSSNVVFNPADPGFIYGDILFSNLTNLSLTTGVAVAGYAQVGHGGFMAQMAQTSGNISVPAQGGVHLTTSAFSESNYAQIGHGGTSSSSTHIDGNIQVGTAGTTAVVLTANEYASAQIGHGGDSALNSVYTHGNITVSGQSIVLTAPTSATPGLGLGSNYAQIGHGGIYFASKGDVPDIVGNINIAAGSLTLTGGNTSGADYAMIGHGGMFAGANSILGNITVTHNGTVRLDGGGTFYLSFAQIGHGGGATVGGCVCGSTGTIRGNISVTGTGDIYLTGGFDPTGVGDAEGSNALIGHGGGGLYGTPASELSGNITVSGTAITLTGGQDGVTYAQIGHSSTGFASSAGMPVLSGNISVTFDTALLLFAGTGAGSSSGGSYAQIGHGGDPATGFDFDPIAHNISGDITITGTSPSSFVSVVAGNGCGCYGANYALIGHGGNGFLADPATFGEVSGAITGNITVRAGSLFIQGGTYEGAFAQVGHHTAAYDLSLLLSPLPPTFTGTSITGNIVVSLAGDLTMRGGTADFTSVHVGHGSFADEFSLGSRNGQIVVQVGGETSLVNGTGTDAVWWIGHLAADRSLITNAEILFQTDTLDYDAGALSANSLINQQFADMLAANLARGTFTFLSTNTGGGLQFNGGVSGTSLFDLNVLSSGNLAISAPLANGGSLFLASGFDGTSGILAAPGAPLVDAARFTAPSADLFDINVNAGLVFGNDISMVAGRSTTISAGSTVSAGDHFLAIVDNFNAMRPDYGASSVFYNFGSIRATTAELFAVDPTQVILGDFPALQGELRGIWYGDANSIRGANYKLRLPVPPMPVVPDMNPDTIPGLAFEDNSDDRLRKPLKQRINQQFSIFYADTAQLPAADRARLWLSSYQVVPKTTVDMSTTVFMGE